MWMDGCIAAVRMDRWMDGCSFSERMDRWMEAAVKG